MAAVAGHIPMPRPGSGPFTLFLLLLGLLFLLLLPSVPSNAAHRLQSFIRPSTHHGRSAHRPTSARSHPHTAAPTGTAAPVPSDVSNIPTQARRSQNALTTGAPSEAPEERFVRWARREGILAANVALGTTNGLRGVVATTDIKAGALVISAPLSSILLSPEAPEENPFRGIATGYWDSAPHTTRLAIKLVAELQQGSRSRFARWIDLLPREPFTPLVWSPGQIAALQYPPIIDAISRQRREWSAAYDELVRTSPKATIKWEDFAWAMTMVRSRAIAGNLPDGGSVGEESAPETGGGLTRHWCLVPYLDMVNSRHGVPANIRFNPTTNTLDLFAGENVPAEQQVTMSYLKDSDELLQHYGFVAANNPIEGYRLTGVLDVIRDGQYLSLETFSKRAALVQKLGLGAHLDTVLVARDAAYLPCVQTLRVLLAADGEDATVAKERPTPHTERRVVALLRDVALRARAAWPTTLEQDLGTPTTGDRAHDLALAYRIEKKKVLTAFLRRIDPTPRPGTG